ncbi:MAG: glutathione S-transferase [Burkholderiales bacterium RIFCSPHIGHO2_02_FULL_66_10]|nr:glutathione S-transferase family protein [Hydrogenophaga sp.]OGB15242.1 MAG: glutathione S-transferase [Burkholderiales bacterium RIFCSPHIGHO2_02_FULL_66_10]
MLTLFHAPMSRSSRIVSLIDEMGIQDRVRIVPTDIPRMDGSGGADPANPHPEGKVPALLHDQTLVTESAAVIHYLTQLFPDTGMAPQPGDPRHGAYLTWLYWYGNVMEPVIIFEAAQIRHDWLRTTFRGTAEVKARLRSALEKGPWLLGDTYSAADLLVHSPYAWFKEATPDDELIRDWVARCMARPSAMRTAASDAALRAG